MKRFFSHFFIASWLLFLFTNETMKAQEKLTYQRPPEEIAKLLTAPPTPAVETGPLNQNLLIKYSPRFISIEEVAQPECRLAGMRINPRTNGKSRSNFYDKLEIKSIKNGEITNITGLPEKARIENLSWSPDGQKIAFTVTKNNGLELWFARISDGKAQKLTDAIVNDVFWGLPYDWLIDSEQIIVKTIVENRGNPPEEDPTPDGPVIQTSKGVKAPVRTYQDLLENEHDEELFEYYGTSQIMLLNLKGEMKKTGEPAIYTSVEPSPNSEFLLVVKTKRPYSYIVPYYRFPASFEIWNLQGKLIRQVADVPLTENLPKGFGAVRTGARSFAWRSDAGAELYWTEAQDGGDLKKDVEIREKIFYLRQPFSGSPNECLTLNLRFGGITWGNDNFALISEWNWAERKLKTHTFRPDKPQGSKKIIFDRNFEDRYSDPGNFEMTTNRYGKSVILFGDKGKTAFLTGQGASPEGNRPFVDKINIETFDTERLWRSKAPYYEYPVQLIDHKKLKVVTRRESKTEVPNYYIRNLKNDTFEALTSFENPYPQMNGITSELITYKREDGISLSGKLYLPAGYKKEEPLPVIMWAYPQEFKSADAAGQITDSPYRFVRLHWGSPLFWLTQGYAILDHPAMPVIGEGDKEPNDTYIEQLVANAEAAIDKLVDMKIADRDKIAIGGHSYGAFMTANLLSHSKLFAAGIARSGAYNRTLTPFGFQAEERTLWEASGVYFAMSPFMHVDKIEAPVLLIHGQADNNSGTYPMQSERYFTALKGHGKIARLVMLPHESHHYRAEESVLHIAWEMNRWLEKFVKKQK